MILAELNECRVQLEVETREHARLREVHRQTTAELAATQPAAAAAAAWQGLVSCECPKQILISYVRLRAITLKWWMGLVNAHHMGDLGFDER